MNVKSGLKFILTVILLFGVATPASARGRLDGWVEYGGRKITTSGINSTTKAQASFPLAGVTVYVAGTPTLAAIYENSAGTVKANPFGAGLDASWYFYAEDGCYDIRFSGGGLPASYTLADRCVNTGATVGLGWVNAYEYGARTTKTSLQNTTAIIAAAVAAGPRGVVVIGPNITYDFNAVTDDVTVPIGVLFFDLSIVNGSQSYTGDNMMGFFDRGDPLAVTDHRLFISSGHYANLVLDNTGKAGSASALLRYAGFSWSGGRMTKGSQPGMRRNIAVLEFGKDPADSTRWLYTLRGYAPMPAVTANYYRWAAGTVAAPGDYCFSAGNEGGSWKYYTTAAGGTTGATIPTHLSGTVSDGGVDWTYVDWAYDVSLWSVNDLGHHFIRSFTLPSTSVTATDLDTTPSIKAKSSLIIANSAPTSVTNFDDGVAGQFLIVLFANANTTLTYGAGTLKLKGSVSVTPPAYGMMAFWRAPHLTAAWIEMYRSFDADPATTFAWNPGNLVDGAGETSAAVTVTGAVFGDYVVVSAPYDLQGITCTAYVSAADTIKARLQNETGGPIDLANGTWKLRVLR